MFYEVLDNNYKWSVRFSWFLYLSLPFVMYFNGEIKKFIYLLFIVYYYLLFIVEWGFLLLRQDPLTS